MSDTQVTESTEAVEVSSRRNLLSKGAVAAAVAAVAGVAMSKSAEADDGNNIVIGTEDQLVQSPTELFSNGFTGQMVFLVNDGTVFRPSEADYPAALGGWSATRSGIYAYTASTSVPAIVGSGGSAGVLGSGDVDFQADGSGRVLLSMPGVTGSADTGVVGSIARDSGGNLWYCHTTNKWSKLAGTSTAGAFHAIAPVRVYDSRAAAPLPGILAPNASRVVSVKDARSSVGTVVVANVVPAGATAVTYNVTATATTGPNYLAVAPGDAAARPEASSLNWGGGYDIANAAVVKLDGSRQVKVFMGDQGGSSHFIIDITGYYL
jgi:hypothetical protein